MAEKFYYPSAPLQEMSVVEQNQSDSLYPNLNQPGLVYDKNIIELEQSISNIFKKYKIQKNDKTSYKNMMIEIDTITRQFNSHLNLNEKNEMKDENQQPQNTTYHDLNFEKFEQNFKLCQYYYLKGQQDLFTHVNIIKARKNELKNMRQIPGHLQRQVYDEMKMCESLHLKHKNEFEHKYGKFKKFKQKLKEKKKQENLRIGKYKNFMNKSF
tara:strand:+ start:2223 stop:2858 length:636 start_codon:yes stop_codon:yes gene_type:complete